MIAIDRDNHLLSEQRHNVGTLVKFFAGQRVDDDFEVAAKQPIPQIPGVCITKAQLKPIMPHLECGNKIDDLIRRYCAHDPKLEGHSLLLAYILRQALCLDSRLVDSFQVRADHLAELSQMREMAFSVKERSAKLSFQLLNCTRERGLRDVALFGCAREVQFLCDRQEISDLMHFHSCSLPPPLLKE